MMYVCNKKIACTPFPQTGLEIEKKSGFATVKTKWVLVPLTVVVGDDEFKYHPGATVWVLGDCQKLPWAVEKFEVDGKEVIFVPLERLVLHKPLATPVQWTVPTPYPGPTFPWLGQGQP